MFSIILPTYNRAHLLPRCIDSILAQDFTDFELLIIDDGSIDGTQELLRGYTDPRIKIFSQANGGVSSARNLGIQNAHGRYFTFIDSDDYILQGFFADANALLEDGELDLLVYGGWLYYPDKPRKKVPLFWDKKRKVQGIETLGAREYFKDFCFFTGISWGCAKFCKTEIVREHGVLFNEGISYGEDFVFWLEGAYFCRSVALRDARFYVCYSGTEGGLCQEMDGKSKVENLLRGYRHLETLVKDEELQGYLAFNAFNHIEGNLSFLWSLDEASERLVSIIGRIPYELCGERPYWIELKARVGGHRIVLLKIMLRRYAGWLAFYVLARVYRFSGVRYLMRRLGLRGQRED